ncbi:MAG: helix-turn-helix domain-containing protein [Ktedonobacteraceae bacterium]|nr:helix-turn-helix domain-containing protein [Ktedonobacteraceae bacterium]
MERLLTTEEIAEYLRVDVVTIRRLINRNELPAYRIGGEYRFTESDLENYLQRQRVGVKSAEPGSPLSGTIEAGPFFEWIHKVLQGKQTSPSDVVKSDRFDRFTDQARRVLKLSQDEAQRFKHNYVGTEHLLLGLIDEGEGTAIQALNNLGVELAKIRANIEIIVSHGDRVVLGDIGLTPRAKKVIELAVDEARRLDHHYIGTEHLLLGLLREGEGIAAGVLESLGVTLEHARTEVQQLLSKHAENETIPVPPVPSEATSLLSEGAPELICSSCNAHSPVYFHYCFNCGQPLKPE